MKPLVFKWLFPRSVTASTAASVFTTKELQASCLEMCWRMTFSDSEMELSPKKPIYFIPTGIPMVADAVKRLV